MNNSSSDLTDDFRKLSMPFRVTFDNRVFLSSKDFLWWSSSVCSSEKVDKTIDNRFDILDIRSKKTDGLTIEQILKGFNKIVDEIDNPPVWKYEEKLKPVMSEDYFAEMIERDLRESFKDSVKEFVMKQQVNNRFEILDL